MSDVDWTPELIDTLKTRWAEGLSASQIAAEIPYATRNAVIGKINRLGLTRDRKVKNVGGAGQHQKRALPKPLFFPAGPGISLLELTNSTCRWPVGGSLYCGVPEADMIVNKPYCAKHTEISRLK